MRARRCGIAIVLTMAPLVLIAQAPPETQEPAFRAGITYVEVDVFVTDRNGAFVRDLSRDDFEVLDNGVRQEIASFDLVDLARRSVPRFEPAGGTDREGRIYALLLDSTEPWSDQRLPLRQPSAHLRRLRELAQQFVDTALQPGDVMSVWFVRHGRIPLQEVLMRHHPVRSAVIAQEPTGSRALLRSAIDAFGPENLRRDDVLTSQNSLAPLPASYLALQETAEALARITGRRKAILWIGGRVPFQPSETRTPAEFAMAYRDAIRAATRHNVAIYPIDPAGLGSSRLDNLGALRAVAEDTGGTAIVNTNNFSDGFARIVDDNSTYYLLGYSPTVQHTDGRFHEITVRVARSGVRVRARRGYFAAEPAVSSPAALPLAPLSAAAAAAESLGEYDRRKPFRIRTTAWTAGSGAAAGTIHIVGELGGDARREHPSLAGATADVALTRADGSDVLTERLALETADAMFSLTIPGADVGLPPGEYTLRVRLHAGGTTLSETARVHVPEQNGSPLGEAVLWRRGPSTGPRDVVTADPHFRRTEQLRLELPAASAGETTARLLDRTGTPLPIPLQVLERPDGEMTWVVIHVPLAPLARAEYVVEVTQGDTTRLTPFRIVP